MSTTISKPKESRTSKQFMCNVIELHQRDCGKYKKYPYTKIVLAVRGKIDQKIFEEICSGICNGHFAIVTIHYRKATKQKIREVKE